MTRLALLALLALAAGCAASRPVARIAPFHEARNNAISATADSLTLRWTAPRWGTRGCGPDTRDTLRDPVRCDVLRLRGQAAAWRPGCEASVACWDSVRAQTVPDTVAQLWTMPGAACSVRVAGGEYVVVARNAAGVSCWSRVVR